MEPMPLTVTVPTKYNSTTLAEKGVKIVYVKKEWHTLGVCQIIGVGTGEKIIIHVSKRFQT